MKTDNDAGKLFEELKPLIDAHITMRIVEFYRGLLERAQIAPMPAHAQEVTIVDCKADRISDADRPQLQSGRSCRH